MALPLTFRLTKLAGRIALAGALLLAGGPRWLPAAQARIDREPAPGAEACVILLHGLARTHRSMGALAQALEAAGYRTVNQGYASRKAAVEDLAMEVIPAALDQCAEAGARRIHFVTHSMGGLLVRYYLTRQSIDALGRVVMLSPPNQGSEVSDTLREHRFYRWYNGPAGQQLGTRPEDLPARLGPVTCPVGVITGNVHAFFDGWLAKMIPGEDDGKVSVERARVEGMADFLVLPYSHAFIMRRDETIAQTIHFLRHGAFQHRR